MVRFCFSSRRRHTRLQGDWSSDVCSSDLLKCLWCLVAALLRFTFSGVKKKGKWTSLEVSIVTAFIGADLRSEERRVGKECRCRGRAALWIGCMMWLWCGPSLTQVKEGERE